MISSHHFHPTNGVRPSDSDCMIVTWDDEDETDGIRIVPVWKWLLA